MGAPSSVIRDGDSPSKTVVWYRPAPVDARLTFGDTTPRLLGQDRCGHGRCVFGSRIRCWYRPCGNRSIRGSRIRCWHRRGRDLCVRSSRIRRGLGAGGDAQKAQHRPNDQRQGHSHRFPPLPQRPTMQPRYRPRSRWLCRWHRCRSLSAAVGRLPSSMRRRSSWAPSSSQPSGLSYHNVSEHYDPHTNRVKPPEIYLIDRTQRLRICALRTMLKRLRDGHPGNVGIDVSVGAHGVLLWRLKGMHASRRVASVVDIHR